MAIFKNGDLVSISNNSHIKIWGVEKGLVKKGTE
jgi:hypothetical protein